MITEELILKSFPDANNVRLSDFMGHNIAIFESNFYSIEIRTEEDGGYLVVMDRFNSRDGISALVKTPIESISFINKIISNGIHH